MIILNYDDITRARDEAWQRVLDEERRDESRKRELDEKKIKFGDVEMKFTITVKGKAPTDGYPCYIALHGGGGSDTPDINDSQWEMMQRYYLDSVESGVYVAPRGVRDTCDCHSNPESFPCYERLISSLIAFYGVDPNRVYMLGYSAGGDGTLLVTPVLADRFAAGNSSASYTAERNYTSLYNMPTQIQGGENDAAYGRNTLLAKCVTIFNNLKETYGGGYESSFFMHEGKGHHFIDRDPARSLQTVLTDPEHRFFDNITTTMTANTNAVDFLNKYTRSPYPKRIVWDMSYRQPMQTVNSFYWLSAPKDANEGVTVVNIDKNRIIFEALGTDKPITVLLNEKLIDFSQPVTVCVDGKEYTVNVKPDESLIYETLCERGDPYYSFCAKITVTKENVKCL